MGGGEVTTRRIKMATQKAHFGRVEIGLVVPHQARRLGNKALKGGLAPQQFEVPGTDGSTVHYALVGAVRQGGRFVTDTVPTMSLLREGKALEATAFLPLTRSSVAPLATPDERAAFSAERPAVEAAIDGLAARAAQHYYEQALAADLATSRGDMEIGV
jgi:hypothetical protein